MTSLVIKSEPNALMVDVSSFFSQAKMTFAPICPDFVVELRSASDTLKSLQDKLEEYLHNGAQLGLLVDRKNRTIHVYRPGVEPEVLENPAFVSCEPELPGFTLKMVKIW